MFSTSSFGSFQRSSGNSKGSTPWLNDSVLIIIVPYIKHVERDVLENKNSHVLELRCHPYFRITRYFTGNFRIKIIYNKLKASSQSVQYATSTTSPWLPKS